MTTTNQTAKERAVNCILENLDASHRELADTQSQLTATEARLDTAKNFLDESETLWSYEPSKQNPDAWWNELHKLRGRIRAFLSTLTAEKKEKG